MTTPESNKGNSMRLEEDNTLALTSTRRRRCENELIEGTKSPPPNKTSQIFNDKSRYVYRDYSRVPQTPEAIYRQQQDNLTMRVQKLPAKLYAMLSIPEMQHIISWMPHGRSWKIHNADLFVKQVMPRFFEYSNYNSFIRLVNAWGFRRLTKGPDKNAYWHEVSGPVTLASPGSANFSSIRYPRSYYRPAVYMVVFVALP
jgi:HSF-type DNA-binding